MKIALSLLSVLSVALLAQGTPLSADQHWASFKSRYGRQFSDIETRKEAFLAAKARVDQHNAEADQGLHTYYREVNDFSVMTEEEFDMYRGLKPLSKEQLAGAKEHVLSGVEAPASVDLRNARCMPAIKDQGGCGSCWAFSSIHCVDYRYCAKNNLASPITFSEQNMVDCSEANNGCDGGDQAMAFRDMKDLLPNGVMTAASYPYTGRVGYCMYNPYKGVAKVTGVTVISSSGAAAVAAMKDAIATGGSISISIDASQAFGEYTGGIFSGPCTLRVNHAVNAVGYGTDPYTGTGYWIVRNSWGTSKGIKGYFLVKMGVNMCGIETPYELSYPSL